MEYPKEGYNNRGKGYKKYAVKRFSNTRKGCWRISNSLILFNGLSYQVPKDLGI